MSHLQVTWRNVSLASMTITVGAVAALAVVASVSDASALSTVALALAVVAFVIQIVVFVAQLTISNQQLGHSERLNAETLDLVAEIRALARGIESVQNTQVQRLLDHALGKVSEQVSDQTADISEGLGSIRSDLGIHMAPEDAIELDERFAEILDRLASLGDAVRQDAVRTDAVRTDTVRAEVACPHCGLTSVVPRIGVAPGSSALPTCEHCGRRFHAHRDGSGQLFVREPGEGAPFAEGTWRAPTATDLESWARAQLARSNMELPPPPEREAMLERLYGAWSRGELTRAGQIRSHAGGTAARSAKVGNPLFWALINRDYGPLPTTNDPSEDSLPLSGKSLVAYEAQDQPMDQWVSAAHAAWLAQAVYRLGRFSLNTDELSEIFFGEPAAAHADLLNAARRNVGI